MLKIWKLIKNVQEVFLLKGVGVDNRTESNITLLLWNSQVNAIIIHHVPSCEVFLSLSIDDNTLNDEKDQLLVILSSCKIFVFIECMTLKVYQILSIEIIRPICNNREELDHVLEESS